MIKDNIAQLLLRDLQKLRDEISLYEDEALLWQIAKGISNPGGNLCLHLLGNLNTYIGNRLGNTGYIRNREQEFSLRDVPKATLLEEIGKITQVISETFAGLTDEQLQEQYPDNVFGSPMSTEYFLLHLIGHLNYHLGQVNYHRRILSGLSNPVS